MKDRKKKSVTLPEGVSIVSGTTDYSNDPIMLKKIAQMKSRLEQTGLPKGWAAKAVK